MNQKSLSTREGRAQLIAEIEAQRNLMTAVATGGPRIDSANGEYKERQQRIQDALSELGLRDPNPYSDLWSWYGKWSSGDLPTYQSRRQYIRDLYAPLVAYLSQAPATTASSPPGEPSGWLRADRGLTKVWSQIEYARHEEDFQAVGLLCRETLISLAQVVYDPTRHATGEGKEPSPTDAKRMLEAYIEHELQGSSNEAARKYAKASLDLANALQHKRTAGFRDAAMCAEATRAVLKLMAIVAGQQDPDTAPVGKVDISEALVEFSYRFIDIYYEWDEHLYELGVIVENQGSQVINDFKLEFTFPDLDSIPKRWEIVGFLGATLSNAGHESSGPLVEVKPGDNTVSVRREAHLIRVTYRSRDALLPNEKVDLAEAIGLRYRINRSVYANLEDVPPVKWILYADNMLCKQGEVPISRLNNY